MRVQLLHTCLVNDFAPEVGFAVVRVLERLGCEVQVPLAQTCCGQPALNAGFADEARVAVLHTIEVLEATDGPIIVPSGSCGDMVIHQFTELVSDQPGWRDRARAVADRCHEFSAFVASHPRFAALQPELAARVVYHPSCHLRRGLGIDAAPRAVLNAVRGVEVVAVDGTDDCCGFGGLFAVKHPDISTRMADRKLAHLEPQPDRLVSCDLGCLLHLGGRLHRHGSPIRVQHLAELLDDAIP